ncbi:Short chain dehydrogenase sirR [Colletotrichum orbiculare MAFF 240422]|uniref:Short chain dehydrogenase sirR n=1 Tax=Colletotrichum orbiculare (strain 104-T / ATCC 96160 / CBS 514.97 / LARS 414 / MAFF 240422) TaxID=1213857 RepID=N4VGV2_COLOR|nr:Short chain dehydrogenase sirR [Colletotrichum orbiculare MAFF 240422]
MAHALILGASGISGWSLMNQARNYPTPTTFVRITGTTNRPLTLEQARLPPDSRMLIASGIDFTKSVEEVVVSLQEKIPDVNTVTHVFFTAYIQTNDFASLRDKNTSLLDVAIRAIEQVAPDLKSVILQTGGKGYGLEFPKEIDIKVPLRESHPRIPEPWASNIFYYTQYDTLKSLSHGKSWTFSEIRPDGIVGFTPTVNAMNLAQGIGVYLSIYRAVRGAGAPVPFPGHEHGYRSTHTDTFQDLLAKMEIYAAVNTEMCGDGGVFNIANASKPVTWQQVWPGLCAHFGLVGEGPAAKAAQPIKMETFVKENKAAWSELAREHGLDETLVDRIGWGFVHLMVVDFDFDRQYDLSRAREVGFADEVDTVESYVLSWERMRAANQLPPV